MHPRIFLDIIGRLGYTIYEKWCYRQTVPHYMLR